MDALDEARVLMRRPLLQWEIPPLELNLEGPFAEKFV